MNIISINKIIIIALLLLPFGTLLSQVPYTLHDTLKYDNNFGITVETIGGLSYNLRSLKIKSKRINLFSSLRILWNSNRKLNIGIETSYLMIGQADDYKKDENLGTSKFDAKLDGIPISLVFNMRIWDLDWIVGIGTSYIISTISTDKEEIISTTWSYCFNFGLGYTIDISKHFGFGLETKFFSLSNSNYIIGAGTLKLVYHILY